MIGHVVMWTLKEQAEGRSGAENAVIMKEKLDALAHLVPGILSFEVGLNISDSDTAYDIVLTSTFETAESFAAYRIHPTHEKVKEFVAKVRDKRAVVDYIV